MAYFKNFPLVEYLYGGETSLSLAQNLTVAVSLIDELKGNATFYNSFEIKDNERPDTLSYLLYGTTDYYWTFYFLNQDLRESGWPLTEKELLPLAKTSYPNFVFTTADDISTTFLSGETITGNSSGAVGTIRQKKLDMGQIIVSVTSGTFLDTETVFAGTEENINKTLTNVTEQYNAVHHYENTDGEYQDINPYTFNSGASSFIPITNLNRMVLRNDELRTIDVFKPEVAAQVAAEFNNLLRFE
jgi:hypothetical protein